MKNNVCYYCETYDDVLEAIMTFGNCIAPHATCEEVAKRLWDKYTSRVRDGKTDPITFRIKGSDIVGWDFLEYYRSLGCSVEPFCANEVFSDIDLEGVLGL